MPVARGGGFGMVDRFAAAWVALTLAFASGLAAAQESTLDALAEPGRVLLLRHARAPGYGDPPEFRLDACDTQRNLDEVGRKQARRLGERLRAAGIDRAKLYSSQWCRCLETARLLDLGPVEPLPALNSFFQRRRQRGERLAALRRMLAALPQDGPPTIMVTHQVTISALTGGGTPSGGGSIFALNGTGEPTLLGHTAPD
ncbi:MAG: histidine phosphatase family protein [Zoogloeaceae bacterium]|nr:histidine phosphatase family protein [Zoogloeaceae bacterium]